MLGILALLLPGILCVLEGLKYCMDGREGILDSDGSDEIRGSGISSAVTLNDKPKAVIIIKTAIQNRKCNFKQTRPFKPRVDVQRRFSRVKIKTGYSNS